MFFVKIPIFRFIPVFFKNERKKLNKIQTQFGDSLHSWIYNPFFKTLEYLLYCVNVMPFLKRQYCVVVCFL